MLMAVPTLLLALIIVTALGGSLKKTKSSLPLGGATDLRYFFRLRGVSP